MGPCPKKLFNGGKGQKQGEAMGVLPSQELRGVARSHPENARIHYEGQWLVL